MFLQLSGCGLHIFMFHSPPTVSHCSEILDIYVVSHVVVSSTRLYPSLDFVFSPFSAGECSCNFLGAVYTSSCFIPHPRCPTAVRFWTYTCFPMLWCLAHVYTLHLISCFLHFRLVNAPATFWVRSTHLHVSFPTHGVPLQ